MRDTLIQSCVKPKGVAALRTQWKKTKHCASPRCSPNNSDNEEEEDVNDKEGGGKWAQLD